MSFTKIAPKAIKHRCWRCGTTIRMSSQTTHCKRCVAAMLKEAAAIK